VQVEDAVPPLGNLVQHVGDLLAQLVLGALPLGVPGRGGDHAEAGHGDRPELAQLQFRALYPGVRRQYRVGGHRVVVAGRDDAPHRGVEALRRQVTPGLHPG